MNRILNKRIVNRDGSMEVLCEKCSWPVKYYSRFFESYRHKFVRDDMKSENDPRKIVPNICPSCEDI